MNTPNLEIAVGPGSHSVLLPSLSWGLYPGFENDWQISILQGGQRCKLGLLENEWLGLESPVPPPPPVNLLLSAATFREEPLSF